MADLRHFEPGIGELSPQVVRRVAPLVAERPVELPEEPRVSRDDHAQRAAWREELAEPCEHGRVVGDVLEDVEAHDRVERPVHAPRVAFDDARPRHVPAQEPGELRIGLERDDVVDEPDEPGRVGAHSGAGV